MASWLVEMCCPGFSCRSRDSSKRRTARVRETDKTASNPTRPHSDNLLRAQHDHADLRPQPCPDPHVVAGDEVLVTQLEHDANVTPWHLAAKDAGATVKTASAMSTLKSLL